MLLFLVAAGCSRGDKQIDLPAVMPVPPSKGPSFTIALLSDRTDPKAPGFLRGAQLAASELSGKPVAGRRVRVERRPLSGVELAGLTDDGHVVGAMTAAGAAAIEAAGRALDEAAFPVFELTDDLYETGRLRESVFQSAAPYSWQAFRLARYFGPEDRGYSHIGFLREPGLFSDAASQALGEAVARRGLKLLDAPGDQAAGLESLRSIRPEAVVIAGSGMFRKEAAKILSAPGKKYRGRNEITNPWRPQPAFFQMHLGADESAPAAGSVAAGDYAAYLSGSPVEAAQKFSKAFKARFDEDPLGDEVLAYDGVHVLAEAVRRAGGANREKVLDEIEKFDRVRFGHLPISLGPDDHVLAERDVLGLWAAGRQGWRPVMRTFTSDLQRTNILEEDWPAFFDGTTPGAEAPFYHQAKSGITSDKGDPLN